MNTTSCFQPRFHSGLRGPQLPFPKYLYPSPFENANRLTCYSSIFNSIGINSSFYKIPQAATVFRWAASVSENLNEYSTYIIEWMEGSTVYVYFNNTMGDPFKNLKTLHSLLHDKISKV